MKVALITRSTLYAVPGGDTVQITETANHLNELGIKAQIFLSDQAINYKDFQLLHFFNITRPANILYHINKTDRPFVVSPIFVDYSEYDKKHRKGFSGFVLRNIVSAEYAKAIGRWMLLKDSLRSKDYLWKGQERSINDILRRVSLILPNSLAENNKLQSRYSVGKPYVVVPNGVNEQLFSCNKKGSRDERLVICAARIEGIKNQLGLIKALNKTEFTLVLIGQPTANQKAYYNECKRIAAENIVFAGSLTQEQLVQYYRKAKVHVLPSWFETCGLSSLEAAAMGCNIVITGKGFTRDYFGDEAFYCDPEIPESIHAAILKASKAGGNHNLRKRVLENFTWKKAAEKTLQAYNMVLTQKEQGS